MSFAGKAMDVSQWTNTLPDSPPKLLCFEPKKFESHKRKRGLVRGSHGNWASVMEQAKDVQASLAPEFPSFVKTMLHSHVAHGFSLALSKKFCDLHLPKQNSIIVLEDVNGKVFETKYLVAKCGLSAGWRGFSISHKLVEGDVLVFQLVSPCKFKIYIIRSNGLDEVDCALGLLEFEAHNAHGITNQEVGVATFKDGAESLKPLHKGNPNDNQKNSYGMSYHYDKESDNTIPKNSKSNERKGVSMQSLCENQSYTMERAKVVQENLNPKFPSFVKNMVQSHISRCFCLSLPRKFCNSHMPKHDATMVLEDENGNVCESTYLAGKVGLSAGWRGFSIAHKLVEGDVLVFHLVSPCKFKIYIIRSNGSDEVDCALDLLKLEAHNAQGITNQEAGIVPFKDRAESLKPLLKGNPDYNDDIQKNSCGISYQSDKESDNTVPKKSQSNEWKGVSAQSLCENQSSMMDRAKMVQANLDPKFPSFIKKMVQSHVSRCFCLSLPRKFCNSHLPKHDATMVLEDENGNICESKYLERKVGLSAGWRGFSIAHKLVEGDVLVFHLVSPFKFKIYIIRSNGPDEVDCALDLLKLEARNSQADNKDVIAIEDETESSNLFLDGKPNDGDDDSQKINDLSDQDSDDLSPEVLDGIRLSDSVVPFEEVKSIKDFEILVNGLVINSEFSKHLQGKYYELCCSQKAFLHENLLEGLNCKLVAGIISETINIADGIRASKITSSVKDFSIWAKTLIAFEGLGMSVQFLRARLDQLVNVATKAKRILEAQVLAAKQEVTRLDTEIETLGLNYHELELTFEEVASAPW